MKIKFSAECILCITEALVANLGSDYINIIDVLD